jgi:hypothetical protein
MCPACDTPFEVRDRNDQLMCVYCQTEFCGLCSIAHPDGIAKNFGN